MFAAGNMDLEWVGPKPTPTGTPTGTCTPNLARTTSQPHLATQVRIAAGGPQGANVLGVTDQTELFHTMRRALGLSQ